jgi:hypothetical protein
MTDSSRKLATAVLLAALLVPACAASGDAARASGDATRAGGDASRAETQPGHAGSRASGLQVRVVPDRLLGAVDAGESGSLSRALASAAGPAVFLLAPGHYVLEPAAYTDPTCGNCEDATESVPGTLGLLITGRGITLRGAHQDSVVIHTRAGYGLLFEDCAHCSISGVTITGGVRDVDGRATNGAVVVRRSTVTLENCTMRDNIGDSAIVAATVVGIAGIIGREAADFTVRDCVIRRNSWDGIALYRGATARIMDNIVDGEDSASGGRIGGGRGVGIGLTWDARATVERNLVTRYWKGIGVFVQADADVRENVVEDILTWGIALWGPAGATPTARIERNVIHRTGACGVLIDRPTGGAAPGTLTDNLIIRTGQNERYDDGTPYCWQRPVARPQVPDGFTDRGNVLFDNRQPRVAGSAPPPAPELMRETLLQRARPLTSVLAAFRATGQAALFAELPELRR